MLDVGTFSMIIAVLIWVVLREVSETHEKGG